MFLSAHWKHENMKLFLSDVTEINSFLSCLNLFCCKNVTIMCNETLPLSPPGGADQFPPVYRWNQRVEIKSKFSSISQNAFRSGLSEWRAHLAEGLIGRRAVA